MTLTYENIQQIIDNDGYAGKNEVLALCEHWKKTAAVDEANIEVKPETAPRPLYTSRSDIKVADVIALFTKFSDELEGAANRSTFDFVSKRLNFLVEEINETMTAHRGRDLIEMVDGYADVAFICITQIYHIFRMVGFDHALSTARTRSALWEVGYTNMLKNLPTGPNEKITKPEGWEAPKIKELFEVPQPKQEVRNVGRGSAA